MNDFKLRSPKDDYRGHNPRANDVSDDPENHVVGYGLHGFVFSGSQGVGCPTKKKSRHRLFYRQRASWMDHTHAGRPRLPTPLQNGLSLLQVTLQPTEANLNRDV
ncbi:unnamed protein product [Discosporangium mesarthrocarpum]